MDNILLTLEAFIVLFSSIFAIVLSFLKIKPLRKLMDITLIESISVGVNNKLAPQLANIVKNTNEIYDLKRRVEKLEREQEIFKQKIHDKFKMEDIKNDSINDNLNHIHQKLNKMIEKL